MGTNETLEDFYRTHPAAKSLTQLPDLSNREHGHFNVFSREFCNRYTSYSRRDFYKISLLLGKGKLFYGDQEIDINQNALVFFNRNVPYSWQAISEEQTGYFCLFTEEFIRSGSLFKNATEYPVFRGDSITVLFVSDMQERELLTLFKKMSAELDSGYVHKYALIRSYLELVIHEAMKMEPGHANDVHMDGSARLTSLFLELLDRQFPIDSPEHKLRLKTAGDYAAKLSVHVNHLNRALKEVTGRTTTEHITEKVMQHSKVLLRQSNWSITEVAYCLGFEYAAYFNNIFKKQTGITPKSYRETYKI
ncbi:AraC family transcriptional regulator [Dyadobacter sp. CY312]|uniref:helix-turn-helix domain-containing protein n=1 Tax=Dyadobacter sp. CY312 TaxID=2907303 RepID=UPI001F2432EC|nr:response regulator transcription factor [Dyadobacter sp. CY312]MCE7039400.1 helix-turn-helix transcriptional regulator [Dyadobacter sp. CY312]